MTNENESLTRFREEVEKTIENFENHDRASETVSGEIYSELDFIMADFGDYEIIDVFSDYVDLKLDEKMTVADIRHEVKREAFREIEDGVTR